MTLCMVGKAFTVNRVLIVITLLFCIIRTCRYIHIPFLHTPHHKVIRRPYK